jgi:uncharacterized protein YndB with AHSA1/START domain
VETTDKNTVTIDLTINDLKENVWRAWTDPALILHWFGSDPNGSGLSANLDVRAGGLFEVTFSDSDQTEHTCRGVYADVQEFSKLSFTWMWKSEPGVESFVTVILTSEKNNDTRMQFQHARLGTASMHNYLEGWRTTFLKLERMLADRKKL